MSLTDCDMHSGVQLVSYIEQVCFRGLCVCVCMHVCMSYLSKCAHIQEHINFLRLCIMTLVHTIRYCLKELSRDCTSIVHVVLKDNEHKMR